MEFLEIPLFDDDIYKLAVRFFINCVFLTLIVRFGIHPSKSEREFAFTAVMMNITAFFICFSLKKLELELGMALGLFAIFGVLRYRTDSIRTKEMTYLFILIGVAVINALSNKKTSYAEILVINTTIFAVTMFKEWMVKNGASTASQISKSNARSNPKVKSKSDKKQRKFNVLYDKLEWLGPVHQADLIADLQQRTGIDIDRVDVTKIDLTRKTASLTIWVKETKSETQAGNEETQ